MLPNQSHAPAMLAYHAPAIRPTTTELVALQSGIDSLGAKISRCPLAYCDTRNLQEAAEELDWLLDRVFSVSQRLGIEIARRRRESGPSYKITTVGILLLDQGVEPTPEERVKLAEDEAKAERVELALAYSFTPDVDEHPVAVGSCDVAILAGHWTSCDEGRPA